jgi:hypothetical protein
VVDVLTALASESISRVCHSPSASSESEKSVGGSQSCDVWDDDTGSDDQGPQDGHKDRAEASDGDAGSAYEAE